MIRYRSTMEIRPYSTVLAARAARAASLAAIGIREPEPFTYAPATKVPRARAGARATPNKRTATAEAWPTYGDASPVVLVAGRYRPAPVVGARRENGTVPLADIDASEAMSHRITARAWKRTPFTGRDGRTGYAHDASVADVLAMPAPLYSALWLAAFTRARRIGFALAGVMRDTAPAIDERGNVPERATSTAHTSRTDDEASDLAADAVAAVWAAAAAGKLQRSPFAWVRTYARRNAVRRAVKRAHLRDGLTDVPTDGTMPLADAALTLHELADAVPSARRAAFLRDVRRVADSNVTRSATMRKQRERAVASMRSALAEACIGPGGLAAAQEGAARWPVECSFTYDESGKIAVASVAGIG